MTKTESLVIGAGMWGTVLAQLMAAKGHRVRAWEHNKRTIRALQTRRAHPALPGFKLDAGVKLFADLAEAVAAPDLILIAVDSKHVRLTARALAALLKSKPLPPVVAVSKGIEAASLKTVCEVIEEEIPGLKNRTMILTGPSFAAEVAQGAPTKVVLAGPDTAFLKRTAALLAGGPLRFELSADRIGAELGGALKNVYAIGSGVIDGLSKAAKNSEAAFLVESAAELKRIIIALGGRGHTAWGLSGVGDLLLTATSAKSRNFRFGREIGKGLTPREAQERISTVVEGYEALDNAHRLCARKKIKAPVIAALWKILYRNARPASILEAAGFTK